MISIHPSPFALDLLAIGHSIRNWIWNSIKGLVRYLRNMTLHMLVLSQGTQFQALDSPLQSESWFEYQATTNEVDRVSTKELLSNRSSSWKPPMCLMKLLDSNRILREACQPTLRHTDLHMGKIFVAPDECSRIVSLIDFQSTSILPAFLQAQWPIFLKHLPNYNYARGIFQPKLPDNFDELDEESKVIASREWSQVKLAKAYEISTYLENRAAHDAMNVPCVFRELFTWCGEVSEVGIVPFHACLIEIFQNWSSLGFTGKCPYSFNQEEVNARNISSQNTKPGTRFKHLRKNALILMQKAGLLRSWI